MNERELVKSTSGIRGVVGNGLDPVMITAYGCAFGTFLKKGTLVIGRDTRPSGTMVQNAVVAGLIATGIDVIDIGIVPTPTVEIAVKELKAAGGICVTASHNPIKWNALKFFNKRGEFITPDEYKKLNDIFESGQFNLVAHDKLGKITRQENWIEKHVAKTLALKTINRAAIGRRKYTVVVDAINGAGSLALPLLLERLGVKVIKLNCDGNGKFVHEPEPTPKNLVALARAVKRHKADLGMACDPDADRLALISDKGEAVSEELTLTIAVLGILRKKKGPTVINLSTSRTTADVASQHGSRVHYAKVGESNVVEMMRLKRAIIGGEGNGGVIYPSFHAGRDSLVAAALVLTALAESRTTLSRLVETFPKYYTIKAKAALPGDFTDRLLKFESTAMTLLGSYSLDRRDGLRFDFDRGWLQLRSSNTEPIFRCIVETNDQSLTDNLTKQVMQFFA